MMEPRPLSPRKTVQLMVILTILAWATQTLLSQWGYGQTTQPATASPAVLEIRCEATVDASDVTLKQLCRWIEEINIEPHGELVIATLSDEHPVRQIGMNEIKAALKDAGVNLSQIEFSGAASCAVRRSEIDDETFARLLTRESPIDHIETAEVTEFAKPQAVAEVAATKPALRKQLVLSRALSAGQKVLPSDVIVQVLIDNGDALAAELDPDDIIGNLAAADLKRGDLLTASSVRPEPLVLKDQFITVALPHDDGNIETVARAMETGIKGQTIKAKNEATSEIYEVTVTAPAAGELKRHDNIAATIDQ